MVNRKIIHVDMDCFYAAVEEKANPSLKGKPVAVSGPPDSRAVVCTANYEARKFGVRAAIPASQARRLCPHLIFVAPNFDLYNKESRKVREIFGRFTAKFEPLSLDEAYLDVTEASHCQGSATLMAQQIRQQIFSELNLTASAGIASNKFLAKIASDWKKPNGQFVIRPQDVVNFMPGLPVEKIFGVGKVTAEKMHRMGLKTCGDLQKLSLSELQKKFGVSRATELFRLCRGQDDRSVITDWERKSMSVEETFGRDKQNLDEILLELPSIYDSWIRRMEKGNYWPKIRGLVVKMKYFDFQGTTHEQATTMRPDLEDFERLIRTVWEKRQDPVRLLGIGVRLAVKKEAARDSQTSQLQFAV